MLTNHLYNRYKKVHTLTIITVFVRELLIHFTFQTSTMDGLYVLSCVVYRVYKRDILVMKNLQIWGTGWAASWAFFKVIEKTQGMTNILFRISSFASSAAK